MNPVIRAVVMFAFLWVVFRVGGRRTLAEITTFDFILLLVIGDAAQQALIGDDYSMTTAALVVVTLLILDIALARLAIMNKRLGRFLESVPVVVIDNGKVLHQVLRREGLDVDEIMTAARELHGLERLDQIRYAIVERHGGISVVPRDDK